MTRTLIAAAVVILSGGMLATSPSSAGVIIHDRSATAGFNFVVTPNGTTQNLQGNPSPVVNPNVLIETNKVNPNCAIGPEIRTPNCAIGPEFTQP